MAIKQLSVFVENKQGKLADLVKVLSNAGINIRALSIADTKDFGILRLIVSDVDRIKEVLKDDYIAVVTDVVAAKMSDETGSLSNILEILDKDGVNIEYMYAFTSSSNNGAYVVIRVDNNDEAEKVLSSSGIETLAQEDMKQI